MVKAAGTLAHEVPGVVIWSLPIVQLRCSETLLYNPRVNKVFTHSLTH